MRVVGCGRTAAVLVCVGAVGLAACAKDVQPAEDFSLLYRPCAPGTQAGLFTFTFAAQLNTGGYSMFAGKVVEQPVLAVPADSTSECALITNVALLSCGILCRSTSGCAGTCPPSPVHDAGTIQITGVTPPLTVAGAYGDGGYQTSFETQHFPPAAPGAPITLSASGGEYRPFTIAGRAITPLSAHTNPLPVARDQPFTLTWENPGQPGPARMIVTIHFANDYPGLRQAPVDGKDYIRCDFADTGTGTVPASLLATLREAGVGGKPLVVLTRRSVDSVDTTPGCVEFDVESVTTRDLIVY